MSWNLHIIKQKVVRLPGPIITKDYFNKYIDELFEQCLQGFSKDTIEFKIAFFEENTLCRCWCEKNGFELYNSEKTMIYRKDSYIGSEVSPSSILKSYEPMYRNGLGMVLVYRS